MKVIITHKNADFDALASLVAAHKLHPDALPVLGHFLSNRVQEFVSLHKDIFRFSAAKAIDWEQVTDIILVDFQEFSRGDGLDELKDLEKFNWIIYDHHPEQKFPVQPIYQEVRQTGSTVGILSRHLREKGVKLTTVEATLLAIGIHSDTGHLTFPGTTVDDVLAFAWLLENGADLNVISEYTSLYLQYEQTELMNKLIEKSEIVEFSTKRALFSFCETEKYIGELSAVTYKISELYAPDIIVIAVKMAKRLYLVGRSSSSEFNLLEIMSAYEPKGHKQAVFAKVKNGNPEEIINDIRANIEAGSKTSLTAKDIMTTPVRTITGDVTVEKAHKLLLRYGHNGFIVTAGDSVEGIITRRDIEKAIRHRLEKNSVSDFMSRYIVPINPDTSFGEIEKLMISTNMGRFPVIEQGRLVGIVTRTDILKTLYNKDIQREDLPIVFSEPSEKIKKISNLHVEMEKYFSPEHYYFLRKAGEVSSQLGYKVYLVGGLVRDLIIGQGRDFDLDLVVEGNGRDFAEKMAEIYGVELIFHQKYGTAKLKMLDGFIDIATARTEFYQYPAANPEVDFSTIKQDLYRRDFTINALAINLNPASFGEILDFFSGYADIQNKSLRILHNLSFIEDPVRIFRAVRLERKLGFSLGNTCQELAIRAMETGNFDCFVSDRIKTELKILFSNDYFPVDNIRRLTELKVIRVLSLNFDYRQVEKNLRRAYRYTSLVKKYFIPDLPEWLIYLFLILANNDQIANEKVISQFRLNREEQKTFVSVTNLQTMADSLAWEDLSDSDLYFFWKKYSPEALVYALVISKKRSTRRAISRFWFKLREIKVNLDGDYLRKSGLSQGKLIGEALERLMLAKLNGQISTLADEVSFVAEFSKNLKREQDD